MADPTPTKKRGRPAKKKSDTGDEEVISDGEAEAEAEKKKRAKKFQWRNSAAKKYLRKQFKDGVISLQYSEQGGPQAVWDQHCKDHFSFKGMVYNSTFTGRLRAVRNDAEKKMKRATVDQENYDNFRELHPVQATNSRGEPRWQGSDAERLLKEDLEEILTLEDDEEKRRRLVPMEFHKTRQEYQKYPLGVFRDHIYQEKRLRKFLNFVQLESTKPSKNKVVEE